MNTRNRRQVDAYRSERLPSQKAMDAKPIKQEDTGDYFPRESHMSMASDELASIHESSVALQRQAEWAYERCVFTESELSEKETALNAAENRIRGLEEQLEDCRGRIFQSLPTYEISDAFVRQAFKDMKENLSNLVESLPNTVDFPGSWMRALSTSNVQQNVHAKPELFPDGLAAAQPELLSQRICRIMLERPLAALPGIKPADIDLFSRMSDQLFTLWGNDGSKQAENWRSNTMRAYRSLPDYAEQHDKYCAATVDAVCKFLAHFKFDNHVDLGHMKSRLREQIILPVADLAAKIACSIQRYEHVWDLGTGWHDDWTVRKSDLRKFTIMDALTHNKISTPKVEGLPDDAKIGDLLLVIYPALYRRCADGQDNILVEKAVIFVRLSDPPQAGSAAPRGCWMGM